MPTRLANLLPISQQPTALCVGDSLEKSKMILIYLALQPSTFRDLKNVFFIAALVPFCSRFSFV